MTTWGFGLAILTVLLLTRWDRSAFPWALTLFLGWLAGNALYLAVGEQALFAYPVISLGVCVVLTTLFRNDASEWKAGVCAFAVMMLLADVWLFSADVSGGYVGGEYATLTNVGLLSQLVLIGHRGAWNAGSAALSWMRRGMGRVVRFRVAKTGPVNGQVPTVRLGDSVQSADPTVSVSPSDV